MAAGVPPLVSPVGGVPDVVREGETGWLLSENSSAVIGKRLTAQMCIRDSPNMIDPSVPIGRDDSENVEVERFGEPTVPPFEVPYHVEIMEPVSYTHLDVYKRQVCRCAVLKQEHPRAPTAGRLIFNRWRYRRVTIRLPPFPSKRTGEC